MSSKLASVSLSARAHGVNFYWLLYVSISSESWLNEVWQGDLGRGKDGMDRMVLEKWSYSLDVL